MFSAYWSKVKKSMHPSEEIEGYVRCCYMNTDPIVFHDENDNIKTFFWSVVAYSPIDFKNPEYKFRFDVYEDNKVELGNGLCISPYHPLQKEKFHRIENKILNIMVCEMVNSKYAHFNDARIEDNLLVIKFYQTHNNGTFSIEWLRNPFNAIREFTEYSLHNMPILALFKDKVNCFKDSNTIRDLFANLHYCRYHLKVGYNSELAEIQDNITRTQKDKKFNVERNDHNCEVAANNLNYLAEKYGIDDLVLEKSSISPVNFDFGGDVKTNSADAPNRINGLKKLYTVLTDGYGVPMANHIKQYVVAIYAPECSVRDYICDYYCKIMEFGGYNSSEDKENKNGKKRLVDVKPIDNNLIKAIFRDKDSVVEIDGHTLIKLNGIRHRNNRRKTIAMNRFYSDCSYSHFLDNLTVALVNKNNTSILPDIDDVREKLIGVSVFINNEGIKSRIQYFDKLIGSYREQIDLLDKQRRGWVQEIDDDLNKLEALGVISRRPAENKEN